MRKVPIFLIAIVLVTAGALPVSVSAKAELIPGGWLQPPRVLPAPPPPEASPAPAAPAAAEPVLVRPPPPAEPAAVQPLPSPKVPRPAVQRRPPAVRTAPSDGKVQF
jgi:hypothetical protein